MLRWRREGRERGEAGCKLAASFDTIIKKPCERDRWAMY